MNVRVSIKILRINNVSDAASVNVGTTLNYMHKAVSAGGNGGGATTPTQPSPVTPTTPTQPSPGSPPSPTPPPSPVV
ncbi:hypothetical protein [Staphylospora marina]|uniref:hypothetical protein n=1 Tax=Staphylospora marina TaxID=2490858 RepID=UPI000F5BE7F0|nr:hypothetical protein [Staphylospora marina]